MSRRGGFVTELGIAVVIATVVGVAFLLATGELGAAWEALRGQNEVQGLSAGDDPSPSPTRVRASVPGLPPPDQTHYIDVNHISSELNEGGLGCQDTNIHIREDQSQTGTCSTAAGSEITIFVFLDIDALPASFDEFNDATEGSVLEGPNWFLASTDREFLTEAQGVLGGEVRDL